MFVSVVQLGVKPTLVYYKIIVEGRERMKGEGAEPREREREKGDMYSVVMVMYGGVHWLIEFLKLWLRGPKPGLEMGS